MSSSSRSSEAPAASAHEQSALRGVELLGRLSALFVERRKQLAESVGLTDQQWQVLEEIQEAHFMPSLFAQRRESSPAAVSKILRQLTDKKLVSASVSEVDARQRNYAVTDDGAAVISRLRNERRSAIEQVWLSFTEAELEQFNSFSSALVQRLEEVALKARG